MTFEEMQYAIEFLLKHQASFDARLDRFQESLEEMKRQADADRTEIRNAVLEMRTGVKVMIGLAEQLTANVVGLGQAQQGNSQRVTRLEDRVTALENPKT